MKSPAPADLSPDVDPAPMPAAGPGTRLPLDQVRWLAYGATTLVHAIHQDLGTADHLTPGHFLVTGAGEVLLAERSTSSTDGALAPDVVAPERHDGAPATAASDQYALGAIIHQLLTGQPPLPATGDALPAPGTVLQDVRTLRDDCPVFVGYAVMRMLATDPAARWDSLDEVRDAFLGPLPPEGGAPREALASLVRARAAADELRRVDAAALVIDFDTISRHTAWTPAARTTPVRTRLVTPTTLPAATTTAIKTPNIANEALRLVLPVGEPSAPPKMAIAMPRPAVLAGAGAVLVAIAGGTWLAMRSVEADAVATTAGWTSSAARATLPTPDAEPIAAMRNPGNRVADSLARAVADSMARAQRDSAAKAAAAYEQAVIAMLDSVTRTTSTGRDAATPAPVPVPVRTPAALAPARPAPTPTARPRAAARTPTPPPRVATRPATSSPRPPADRRPATTAMPSPTAPDPIVVAADAAFGQRTRAVTTTAPTAPRPTPVNPGPVAPPTRLPASAMSSSAPVLETPTAADVRAQAVRATTRQRMATAFNEFLADAADYTVSTVGGPVVVENAPGRARAKVDVRLTKYDAAGRRVSRLTTVTLDVTRENGVVSTSAVSASALRQP